jgi:hypothetical protein
MDTPTEPKSGANAAQDSGGHTADASARPAYTKPVIRKYNQIVQVKPYGPSEKEAG